MPFVITNSSDRGGPVPGLFGREHVAGEDQLHGFGLPHRADQPLPATCIESSTGKTFEAK